MIQLAGHLKGRALQEWDLIPAAQRATFAQATESLRLHLDPASKTMAAQDFRHISQRESDCERFYPPFRACIPCSLRPRLDVG